MEGYMERQKFWRWKIAFYLFLAGTGAGACIVGVVADLFFPGSHDLARRGVFLGTILVILGIPFLILDLGRKERFLRAGFSLRTAWIGRGFHILSAFIIFGVILIGLWVWPFRVLEGERSLRLVLDVITGVLAFGVAAYTGLLLRSMKSIHFWDTPLIVILFLISALSTGTISLVLVSANHPGQGELDRLVLNALLKADFFLLLIEFFILAFYLVTMHGATEASGKSVHILVRGELRLLFWGGIALGGLVVPLILKSIEISHSGLEMAGPIIFSSFLILVGGLLLRYGVLAAGVPVTPLLPNCR